MNNENQIDTNTPEQIINSTDFSELVPITISNTNRGTEIKLIPPQDLQIHPLLKQFNEPMKKQDSDILLDDIKLRGIIVPIQINQFKEIIDGVHRWEQAIKAGLTAVPTQEFIFANDIDQELHILKSNGLRKTISTQHKYLSIARASKLFEIGRGGPRSKSKEASDTSLKSDVLSITAKYMHVSSEVVKVARRYEREILKYPKHHQVDPTKFIKSIVPLMILKNDQFRESLIQYAIDGNKDLSNYDTSMLELYDSLICRCKDTKRQSNTSNFIIERLKNRQKITVEELANKLGLSEDLVKNEADKRKSKTDEDQESSDTDNSKSDSDDTSDNPRTPRQIFSDFVDRLEKRVSAIENAVNSYGNALDKITTFSSDYTVSIKRLCEHSTELKSALEKANLVQTTIQGLQIKFTESGFQQSWDDRLKLFDSDEDLSSIEDENDLDDKDTGEL